MIGHPNKLTDRDYFYINSLVNYSYFHRLPALGLKINTILATLPFKSRPTQS